MDPTIILSEHHFPLGILCKSRGCYSKIVTHLITSGSCNLTWFYIAHTCSVLSLEFKKYLATSRKSAFEHTFTSNYRFLEMKNENIDFPLSFESVSIFKKRCAHTYAHLILLEIISTVNFLSEINQGVNPRLHTWV